MWKKLLLVGLVVFSIIVLGSIFMFRRQEDRTTKTQPERSPLITAPIFDQWAIFPSASIGMEEVQAPPEAPEIGSVPRIDAKAQLMYQEGMFHEVVERRRDEKTGLVRYPDGRVMCYASYSETGDLQWMVHKSPFGGYLSAGEFSEGIPVDGLFLLDLITGRIIADSDIYSFFAGRDLFPDLGVVELINGKVVGMASLRNEKTGKLVQSYVLTKPQIRDGLEAQFSAHK